MISIAQLNLAGLLPEMLLLTMACIILVIDAYLPKSLRNLTYQLTQGSLIGTALLILATFPGDKQVLAMNDMFVIDQMGAVLKFFILSIVFMAFVYSRNYLRDRNILKGEYFVLGLFAVLGMMIMVSAHSLLTVYLGLELLSLSLYTMVAMHRESQVASEAAMKYFVLGALASGMLLYGMSMLYGITGTLDLTVLAETIRQIADDHTVLVGVTQSLSDIHDVNIAAVVIGQHLSENAGNSATLTQIAQILAVNVDNSAALAAINPIIDQNLQEYTILVFGLVFIIVGLAFKLGAVPFHMWIPDIYQGAPTAVTLFIASAPKIAAFAMLMRLLVDGMQNLHADWQNMLILLSILSMAIGNILAIAQSNIKRMLAYSTIAHVGYLLLGIVAATPEGYAASMFYVVVYTLMTLGAFGMIILLSRAGFEAERLEDFKGLNERNSWYAALMLILMLSMAGVPPMVGFWAKWSVLAQVVHSGFVWLAVVAVIFAIIGAFYYLRIIKLMYFDKAENTTPIDAGMDMRVALSANALVILLLGLMPHSLMVVCLGALGVA